jgi:predicted transposase YbfD/YdcC
MLFRKSASNIGWKPFRKKPVAEKKPETGEKNMSHNVLKMGNASCFNALARGHWGIENQLHWVLDVTFREDSCRVRSGYAPPNLSVLRKMALQIVSNQKDKLSINKRTYKAALDTGYLKKLIGF